MNRILEEIIRRTVSGEWTALQALESAWQSGIREGIARQKLRQALDANGPVEPDGETEPKDI